jgi:hypothetical protein
MSCLYVLPASTPDASDFSASRFDPALELSPHLSNMFSDVKNVGHKRAGSANLFIRGSRSRSQLKSLPVGGIVCDEIDEFNQDNVPMIEERQSGQNEKWRFDLSTATIDNFGINVSFRMSTQDHYFFKCPHCSKLTELTFPDCLIITAEEYSDPNVVNSHLICVECKGVLHHENKGAWLNLANAQWVSAQPGRLMRGFHINQLYSFTVPPYKLAQSYLRAQTNPADEQEFYNSKLGLTHTVEGARVTDAQIEACTVGRKKVIGVTKPGLITLGVDVGRWLHYEVTEWHVDRPRETSINNAAVGCVLSEGKVLNFDDLDRILRDYAVTFCVIDAQPERRKALEFARRHWGRVKTCFYVNSMTNSKEIRAHDEESHAISVDRTSWLDMSLGRVQCGRLQLPCDVSVEYKNHLKSLVRVYQKDKDGNPVGRYIKGNDEDHFGHARNYSEIALNLAVKAGQSHTIKESVL